ncbi:MAG: hypothetical protein ACP5KN_10060, partial [Armatimonadota bacterium]
LVFCYEHRSSNALLDPETELGRIALEGGMGVMANFLRYAGSARLTADVGADDEVIPMTAAGAMPDQGLLWIEDEAVAYASKAEGRVLVAQRGAAGTRPAAHPEGTFLFEQSTLREHLDRVKASPNLWGFWVLDDKKRTGTQRPALRNLYRLIRQWDVDESGEPYGHVVVAGFADPAALTNFDRDVCDAAGVYIYPARRGSFRAWLIEDRLREMVPVMRERDPDVEMIGIYQAFHGTTWEPRPTRAQVRQQVMDFLRGVGGGVMAYSWRMIRDHATLNTMEDLRAEVAEIAQELRAGELEVGREPPEPTPRPEYIVPDLPRVTAVAPEPEMELSPPGAGLAVELGELAGRDGTWLHMRFERWEEGGPQWPGISFQPDQRSLLLSDWSGFGGLVVRVMNLLEVESEIGVAVAGPRGFWAEYFPLPADALHDVAIDLNDVRRATVLSDVQRMTLLMRRPPVATHLVLESCYLVPRVFEVEQSASASVPEFAAGLTPDEALAAMAAVELRDATGAPPVKPVMVRLARSGEALKVRFESAVPDPDALIVRDEERDADLAGEDCVEVLLRAAGGERVARLRVNANGVVRDELVDLAGAHRDWDWGATVASELAEGGWLVDATLPLTALSDDPGTDWEAQFRRLDTELRPLSWVPRTVAGGESLGRLNLLP